MVGFSVARFQRWLCYLLNYLEAQDHVLLFFSNFEPSFEQNRLGHVSASYIR